MEHAILQSECNIKPLCQILECNEAWDKSIYADGRNTVETAFH